MKRTMFVLVTLLVAATMVLTACGTTATPTAAPATAAPATAAPATAVPTAAPVTISIWHQWDGAYLTAIQAAFQQYMTDHPNVTINLDKPNDVQASLKVAIPAGQGPDILAWADDHIGDNALAGNIVPLDDLGITQGFLTSNFEPAAVAGVQWNGKIWALPESQEALAFIYNKDLVTADYLPTDPTNFDDVYAKAKKFFEDKGMPLFCNQGLKGGDAYNVAPIFFGFGVPGWVDDQGKVTLNTPEAVKAGNWLASIKPYMFKDADYNACSAAFTEGKVGAWWSGPWAIAGIEQAKINYGILPLGKPFVGIKTLMVTKNAVDRGTAAVALDIIRYYTSAAVQKQISLVNKTIPAATAALQDPEIQALPTIAGFGAAAKLGLPLPSTPFMSAIWTPAGDMSAAIWNGSQTVDAALAAAQTAAEAQIATMK